MENDSITTLSFTEAREAVGRGGQPEVVAAQVVRGLTPEEKLWCLDGDAPTWAGLDFLVNDGYHKAPFLACRIERIGLPGFAFSDGPRGVVIGNGTCFPVSMGRGATWDPELEERVGDAIGQEIRASGASLYGGVCVNLLRHPAWGRAQETFGEDPCHVGEMGAALVRGVQKHAIACVKHFACNSIENSRFRVDVTVDEVALHEVYLPQFKRIVDEGVGSVMTAYNSVNGEWCSQNRDLLDRILHEEWGFRGFAISDWIMGLRNAAESVTAGLDVEMPYRMVRAVGLPDALASGEASWEDVDASVVRLVATLLRFDEVIGSDPPSRHVIGSSEHRALAREVAARSVVLLRNEVVGGRPVLPLQPASEPTIGVFGKLADTVNLGDGGSSDVWALECVTMLSGLRSVAPGLDIEFFPDDPADTEAARQLASSKDVAIVVVGYTYEEEGEYIGDTGIDLSPLFPKADEPEVVARFKEDISDLPLTVKPDHIVEREKTVKFAEGGDRSSLRLSSRDVDLIRAVASANPRTVVVLQAGSAVLCSEWDASVGAIVQAWYGGSEAGTGLADVLFGATNPSARLPFSIPTNEEHLPTFDAQADVAIYDRWHGWWHLENSGHTPAYPFGFGLSYTTFELGDVSADVSDRAVRLAGTVTNTGSVAGADVVQAYVRLPADDTDTGDLPRRLVGFARVEVDPGSSNRFEISVRPDRLAVREAGGGGKWVTRPGAYTFEVARHVRDPHAKAVTVDL